MASPTDRTREALAECLNVLKDLAAELAEHPDYAHYFNNPDGWGLKTINQAEAALGSSDD
jgi:hypothetical protein